MHGPTQMTLEGRPEGLIGFEVGRVPFDVAGSTSSSKCSITTTAGTPKNRPHPFGGLSHATMAACAEVGQLCHATTGTGSPRWPPMLEGVKPLEWYHPLHTSCVGSTRINHRRDVSGLHVIRAVPVDKGGKMCKHGAMSTEHRHPAGSATYGYASWMSFARVKRRAEDLLISTPYRGH